MHINPDKHIGILFHPRSGSHVLRHYLGSITNSLNLGELFNPGVIQHGIEINIAEKFAASITSENTGTRTLLSDIDIIKQVDDNLSLLRLLYSINRTAVFGISPRSYNNSYPEFMQKICNQDNIQYLQLRRADLLYSVISTILSAESEDWHNMSRKRQVRNSERHVFDLIRIENSLLMYIKEEKEIKEHFGEVPTIYYEQFQFNIGGLRNLFTGIPKNIVSIPFDKFAGNHKDLVENLDEVEDLYEQFVNEYKEYFPQYFRKLQHITIPACQGRQPRDLSIPIT